MICMLYVHYMSAQRVSCTVQYISAGKRRKLPDVMGALPMVVVVVGAVLSPRAERKDDSSRSRVGKGEWREIKTVLILGRNFLRLTT